MSELRGFLGLTGYYRHFVKDYGTVVAPLTHYYKRMPVWNEQSVEAFDKLKRAMVTIPVLALLDFSKTCITRWMCLAWD